MAGILVKIGVAIVAIFIIAGISKRLGSSLGGILFGLPLGAGLNIYFIHAEYGVSFTLQAVPWGVGGLTCTLFFGLAYVLAGRVIAVRARLPKILLSSLSATVAYFAASFAVRALHPGFGTSVATTVLASALTVACLTVLKVPRHLTAPGRDSIRILLTRGLTAGLFVVAITALAGRVGAAWTGVFSAFPTMLFPLIVVLHWEEGERLYPGVILGFAFSVLNLIAFYGLLSLLLDTLPFGVVYLVVYLVSGLLLWLLNLTKNGYLSFLEARGAH